MNDIQTPRVDALDYGDQSIFPGHGYGNLWELARTLEREVQMKREAAIIPVDWKFYNFGPFFYENSTQGCARVHAIGIAMFSWQIKIAIMKMDWE